MDRFKGPFKRDPITAGTIASIIVIITAVSVALILKAHLG